jgi:hypothetical protein
LQLLELEHAVQKVWPGAAIPPRLLTLWLSQRASQYQAADIAHKKQQLRRRHGDGSSSSSSRSVVTVDGGVGASSSDGAWSDTVAGLPAGLDAAQAWVLAQAIELSGRAGSSDVRAPEQPQHENDEQQQQPLTLDGIQVRRGYVVPTLAASQLYLACIFIGMTEGACRCATLVP